MAAILSGVAVAAMTWLNQRFVDYVRNQLGGMIEIGIVEPTV
jgi:hypothetical protein